MVCSYFDDHLAEILSHNHSADLNTTESYQMESSKAHSVSEENINATSSGSFQSQFPSPQLLSNKKLLKSVFTLPTTSASLGHWHLHQPTWQHLEKNYHICKNPSLLQNIKQFLPYWGRTNLQKAHQENIPEDRLPPLRYFAWVCNCAAACRLCPNSAYGPVTTMLTTAFSRWVF